MFAKRVEERKRMIKLEQESSEDDSTDDDATDDDDSTEADDDNIERILARAGLALPAGASLSASTVAELTRALGGAKTAPQPAKRGTKRRSAAGPAAAPRRAPATARMSTGSRPAKRSRVPAIDSITAPSPSNGVSSATNSSVNIAPSEASTVAADEFAVNGKHCHQCFSPNPSITTFRFGQEPLHHCSDCAFEHARESEDAGISSAETVEDNDEDAFERDTRRALRESALLDQPQNAPSEVRNRKEAAQVVAASGGVQAYLEGIAAASDKASIEGLSFKDMCLGCFSSRCTIVAHCTGADLREDKSFCKLMCDECWAKRMVIRDREQCKSCDRCTGQLKHVYRYGTPGDDSTITEIKFQPTPFERK